MKAIRSALVMLTLVAGVAGTGDARTHREGEARCIDGRLWRYCGDHVRASRLPLVFAYDDSGRPATVRSGRAVENAIEAAVDEWNRAWPSTSRLPGATGCARVGTPGAFCYSGPADGGARKDGRNVIGWGDPQRCGHGHIQGLAVACLYLEPGDRQRIAEVDIIINRDLGSSKQWLIPELAATAAGEVYGAAPLISITNWYDVQSAITHELGHALGLEDIGADIEFPYQLNDTGVYLQTMYRWHYPGTTNKRSLAEGDIVGLQYVATESYTDS